MTDYQLAVAMQYVRRHFGLSIKGMSSFLLFSGQDLLAMELGTLPISTTFLDHFRLMTGVSLDLVAKFIYPEKGLVIEEYVPLEIQRIASELTIYESRRLAEAPFEIAMWIDTDATERRWV